MRKREKSGVFFKSFYHAFVGILNAFQGRNFRIQFFIGLLTVVAGFVLNISTLEWLIVLLCIAAVLSLEMINTSIEILADCFTTDYNPKIKKLKDIAAGAVLLCSIISAVIGVIIFLPKIFK